MIYFTFYYLLLWFIAFAITQDEHDGFIDYVFCLVFPLMLPFVVIYGLFSYLKSMDNTRGDYNGN